MSKNLTVKEKRLCREFEALARKQRWDDVSFEPDKVCIRAFCDDSYGVDLVDAFNVFLEDLEPRG